MMPVFVSLPKYADVLNSQQPQELMSRVFQDLCGHASTTIFQNKDDRFLFIFDGLDELSKRINLYDQCNLQAWASNCLFVITARQGFLSEVSSFS